MFLIHIISPRINQNKTISKPNYICIIKSSTLEESIGEVLYREIGKFFHTVIQISKKFQKNKKKLFHFLEVSVANDTIKESKEKKELERSL